MHETHDTIVVGGGFYGVAIALERARRVQSRVVLIEREATLLAGASLINQARVHGGYHYPRSFLTGVRSRRHFHRFLRDYPDCVDTSTATFYAIARQFSKVTSRQFVEFCLRIGAPVDVAPPDVQSLFNRDAIEEVYRVEEASFDANKLRDRLVGALHVAGVEVATATTAVRVERRDAQFVVHTRSAHAEDVLVAPEVFNCTYAHLNRLIRSAGLCPVPLKHELAELVLVDPPVALRERAVTVMCGPFFSITPCPAMGSHVLSHVRYTPHAAWLSSDSGDPVDGATQAPPLGAETRVNAMIADARRFLPCMTESVYRRSLWAVKTILPLNEVDDGRPILLHRDPLAPGLVSVMGSKIDNVYDVLQMLGQPTSEEAAC